MKETHFASRMSGLLVLRGPGGEEIGSRWCSLASKASSL